MSGSTPTLPKGKPAKEKAAATASLIHQPASTTITGIPSNDIAACRALEAASAAALERQQAYAVSLARLAAAEEEACDAALTRADRERAAAKVAVAALTSSPDEGGSSTPAPADLHGTMLASTPRPSPSTTSGASSLSSSTSTPVVSTVGTISFY
jgi:hypothetical protein